MRKQIGPIAAALAAFTITVSGTLADTDVYGNAIQYDGSGNVTYRFWYGNETAEAMSASGSASAEYISPDVFEPRFSTWDVSDGKCPVAGMTIIFR
ncbi:MAG: hypothetical protein ILM98_04470 [Kiritimatiellae bacterium]|nr:hypothetical protein [Kiritimatiellia bacterium]